MPLYIHYCCQWARICCEWFCCVHLLLLVAKRFTIHSLLKPASLSPASSLPDRSAIVSGSFFLPTGWLNGPRHRSFWPNMNLRVSPFVFPASQTKWPQAVLNCSKTELGWHSSTGRASALPLAGLRAAMMACPGPEECFNLLAQSAGRYAGPLWCGTSKISSQ